MPGTITGRVSDDEDDGIEDAIVTVADAATEELETTTKTDENGEYAVSVAPDTYDVRAERIGFAGDEERVTVGPDVTKTVDLRLIELSAGVVGEITDGPGIGVLGTVADDSGSSIGVQGEVASDAGYGFYTPNDARIDGAVDTVEEWQVAIDGKRGLRLAAPEEFEDVNTVYTASGSVVVGHLNDIGSGVAGAVISGGGLHIPANDEPLGNRVTDHLGTISGGFVNVAGDDDDNPGSAAGATVGGGFINEASAQAATVGGGFQNDASGSRATVGGGIGNTASDQQATVGGGRLNIASDTNATVGGGQSNEASDRYVTVGGGLSNTGSAPRATVSGGSSNEASGSRAMVGGGAFNEASGSTATISGGQSNAASDTYATVGGGSHNEASDRYVTISGGQSNEASGEHVTVGGGRENAADDTYATVAGGHSNTASGAWATVPGGNHNTARGDYSFAAGRLASADHDGTFVWTDSDFSRLASSGDNQFLVEAAGGIGFGTDSPKSQLHVVDDLEKNIADPAGHVATVENVNETISADVLALKVGNSTPGGANNYVTFLDGDNDMVGEIDGDGNGGVSYKSSSSDFAEYFPTADSDNAFAPGTVVGLRAGKLARDLDGAHAAFAITATPIVVGNKPPAGEKDDFAAVALVGQVSVRVRGPVEAGDLLIAAGDGVAVPVTTDTADKTSLVAGRALESLDADRGEVQTFVDRVGSTASSVTSEDNEIEQLREQLVVKDERIEDLERRNDELAERLAAVETRVGVHGGPSADD